MESLFNAARRWMWPTETASPPPPEEHQPFVFGLNFKIPIHAELCIPGDVDFCEILKNGFQNFCSEEFPEWECECEFPDFHFPPHCHPKIDFMPDLDF